MYSTVYVQQAAELESCEFPTFEIGSLCFVRTGYGLFYTSLSLHAIPSIIIIISFACFVLYVAYTQSSTQSYDRQFKITQIQIE